MKTSHIVMGVALVAVLWFAFFADKLEDSDVAQPVLKTAQSTSPDAKQAIDRPAKNSLQAARAAEILDLRERSSLISDGHAGLDGKPLENKSHLFAAQSWVPPAPVPEKLKNPPPPPPPVAPALGYRFLGKKLEQGYWEVYLTRGDDTLIVRKESVIDAAWRVDAITSGTMTLTYLPLQQIQRLNIKGND